MTECGLLLTCFCSTSDCSYCTDLGYAQWHMVEQTYLEHQPAALCGEERCVCAVARPSHSEAERRLCVVEAVCCVCWRHCRACKPRQSNPILVIIKPPSSTRRTHECVLRIRVLERMRTGTKPVGIVELNSDMGTSQRPGAPILMRMMLLVRYCTLTCKGLMSGPSSCCVLLCCVSVPLRLPPAHAIQIWLALPQLANDKWWINSTVGCIQSMTAVCKQLACLRLAGCLSGHRSCPRRFCKSRPEAP